MANGTKIKICGIRRAEDCTYINEAMPDYAGFIFWDKSFRYVDDEKAAGLRQLIDPRIVTVGVFVNENAERIAEIAASGTINVVQLHGAEDAEYVSELRSLLAPGTEIWKAFKIRSIDDVDAAMSFDADRVLLDNGYGTGQCFDHSLLEGIGAAKTSSDVTASDTAEISASDGRKNISDGDVPVSEKNAANDTKYRRHCGNHENVNGGRIFRTSDSMRHNEYILAGGLTPENIGEAISKYHPYMIDISSGVETDGCEDREKIMRAVAACRSLK